MSANVVRIERLFQRSWDWSQGELAEFYRVESALLQAGLKIDTERGLSDEGDPWFAFCRPDNGEVIVHIARIGSVYFLAGPAYDGIASGRDIKALVRDLISRHPLIQMRGGNHHKGSRIFLHPGALLIAVVATAFFKSAEARALTEDHKAGDNRSGGGSIRSDTVSIVEGHKTVMMEAAHSAVILTAIAAVLQLTQQQPVPEPDPVTSEASELVDFAFLFPPAARSPSLISAPVAEETQKPDAHGVSVPNAPAHVELADALPLVAVLWDLPGNPPASNQLEKKTPSSDPVPVGGTVDSAVLQFPLLTFQMGSADEASENLPTVQAATITLSKDDGSLQTQTISEPNHLPTALVSALQTAAHTAIEGQPPGLSNGSFASTLIHLVTTQTIKSTQTTETDLPDTSESQSQSGSTTATPPDQSSTSQSPPGAADVSAAIQDFFNHTPNWKMYNNGTGVVVYDVDALASHPGELESVSFDFSDGSTLSLVGLSGALPDFLVA